MYKKDKYIASVDLMLRLYIEYCKSINYVWENAVELSSKISNYGITKPDYTNVKQNHIVNVKTDTNFIELIVEEEKAWKNYYDMLVFIKSVNVKLKNLTEYELDLLYWRYERELTLRTLGDKYNYSHTQILKIIDFILLKI